MARTDQGKSSAARALRPAEALFAEDAVGVTNFDFGVVAEDFGVEVEDLELGVEEDETASARRAFIHSSEFRHAEEQKSPFRRHSSHGCLYPSKSDHGGGGGFKKLDFDKVVCFDEFFFLIIFAVSGERTVNFGVILLFKFLEGGVPNVNFGVEVLGDIRVVVFDGGFVVIEVLEGVFVDFPDVTAVLFRGSLYLSNVYVSKFFDLWVG